jgi:hypothetical protein
MGRANKFHEDPAPATEYGKEARCHETLSNRDIVKRGNVGHCCFLAGLIMAKFKPATLGNVVHFLKM